MKKDTTFFQILCSRFNEDRQNHICTENLKVEVELSRKLRGSMKGDGTENRENRKKCGRSQFSKCIYACMNVALYNPA